MNLTTSKEITKILPALIKTQLEIPAMGKDKKNPHSKSEYLTLDKILSTVNPIANGNSIFITQLPVETTNEDGQSIGVDTYLYHSTGEYLLYPAVYYEFEKGGRMNLTQSVGSIITYAKRYALTSIFGISTNEDSDGVQPEPQIKPQQTQRDKKWQQHAKDKDRIFKRMNVLATDSMQNNASVLKLMLKRTSEEMGEEQKEITPENLSVLNGQLRKAETNFKAHQAEELAKEKEAEEQKDKQTPILGGNTTQTKENINE